LWCGLHCDGAPYDGRTRGHQALGPTFQSSGQDAWKSRHNSWQRELRGRVATTERSRCSCEDFSRWWQPKRKLGLGSQRACATIVVASLRGKCPLSLTLMPCRYHVANLPLGLAGAPRSADEE